MSLLLDHGHPEAASYAIGMLSDEARMVEERTAAEQGVLATLAQMAVSTVPNMGVKPSTTKRAMRLFQNAIKMLTGRDNGQG